MLDNVGLCPRRLCCGLGSTSILPVAAPVVPCLGTEVEGPDARVMEGLEDENEYLEVAPTGRP